MGVWFLWVFLDPGTRTASAIALADSLILVLDRHGLAQLSAAHPDAAVALLLALGQAQAHELRWNTTELRRLIEW